MEEIRARHFTEELTEEVGVNFAMENPTPMAAAKDDIVAELAAVSAAASAWFGLEILLRDSRKTVVRLGRGKEIHLKQLDYDVLQSELRRMIGAPWRRRSKSGFSAPLPNVPRLSNRPSG